MNGSGCFLRTVRHTHTQKVLSKKRLSFREFIALALNISLPLCLPALSSTPTSGQIDESIDIYCWSFRIYEWTTNFTMGKKFINPSLLATPFERASPTIVRDVARLLTHAASKTGRPTATELHIAIQ